MQKKKNTKVTKEGERNAPSRIRLPTLTYAPVQQTGIRETERDKENAPCRLSSSLPYHPSLFSLSLSSASSRSTTNRRRLVICFHTFAAFASLRLFLHLRAPLPFFPLRILSLSHLRQWRTPAAYVLRNGNGPRIFYQIRLSSRNRLSLIKSQPREE